MNSPLFVDQVTAALLVHARPRGNDQKVYDHLTHELNVILGDKLVGHAAVFSLGRSNSPVPVTKELVFYGEVTVSLIRRHQWDSLPTIRSCVWSIVRTSVRMSVHLQNCRTIITVQLYLLFRCWENP